MLRNRRHNADAGVRGIVIYTTLARRVRSRINRRCDVGKNKKGIKNEKRRGGDDAMG